MKKLLCLLFSAVILLSACGGNTEEKYLGEDYVGGNSSIMETETGYYVVVGSHKKIDGSINKKPITMILHWDKNLGKPIYLCSKPECRHDGNSFCTATKDYLHFNGAYMYGDYVYIFGTDESKREDNNYSHSIYRVNLDGTELSNVATYNETSGYSRHSGVFIHRDWAVINFEDYDYPSPMEAYSNNTMLVNIATGEKRILPVCDYAPNKTWYGISEHFAYEDWLYYTVTPLANKEKKLLYRYNFETEVTEKVEIPDYFTDYCVTDGEIYYGTRKVGELLPRIIRYNIETKEETVIYEETRGKAEHGGFMIDYTGVSFISDGNYIIVDGNPVLYDRESGFLYDPENDVYVNTIFDMDGNYIGEFNVDKSIVNYQVYDVDICGDKVYVSSKYVEFVPQKDKDNYLIYEVGYIDTTVSCPISDIASGNVKWTEAYNFYPLFEDSVKEDMGN